MTEVLGNLCDRIGIAGNCGCCNCCEATPPEDMIDNLEFLCVDCREELEPPKIDYKKDIHAIKEFCR